MRGIVPLRGSVLCRKVSGGNGTATVGGIVVHKAEVDIYRIVELPVVPSEGFAFKVGDMVMSNSTGDEIEVNPGDTVYLFKTENIMCKLEDEKYYEKDHEAEEKVQKQL